MNEEFLRDYLAAAALTGLMAGSTDRPNWTAETYARRAYELADAMLIERERGRADAGGTDTVPTGG